MVGGKEGMESFTQFVRDFPFDRPGVFAEDSSNIIIIHNDKSKVEEVKGFVSEAVGEFAFNLKKKAGFDFNYNIRQCLTNLEFDNEYTRAFEKDNKTYFVQYLNSTTICNSLSDMVKSSLVAGFTGLILPESKNPMDHVFLSIGVDEALNGPGSFYQQFLEVYGRGENGKVDIQEMNKEYTRLCNNYTPAGAKFLEELKKRNPEGKSFVHLFKDRNYENFIG